MKHTIKIGAVGSGNFLNRPFIYRMLDLMYSSYNIDCMISGCERGADEICVDYAKFNHREYVEFYADWMMYGRDAGRIRNGNIVDNSDIIVAFWDCRSNYIQDLIDKCSKAHKPYVIVQQFSDITKGHRFINNKDVLVQLDGSNKIELRRMVSIIDVENRMVLLDNEKIYRKFKELCLLHYADEINKENHLINV